MIMMTPLLLLQILSIVVGLVLLLMGLFRMRQNWKTGLALSAGAFFVQASWIGLPAWCFLTQDY